jgi:hypothetical protein
VFLTVILFIFDDENDHANGTYFNA